MQQMRTMFDEYSVEGGDFMCYGNERRHKQNGGDLNGEDIKEVVQRT